jgi:hypothetical protein
MGGEEGDGVECNALSIWQLDLIVQRRVSSDACPLASIFCLEAPLSPSANAPSICQTDSMRMLS